PDSKLQNFNTGRILVPKSQAVNESLKPTKTSTGPKSSKDSKADSLTPLPPLKSLQRGQSLFKNHNLSVNSVTIPITKLMIAIGFSTARPYQCASPFKQILKEKTKPFPPCIHCGFNDYRPDDSRNYPECDICGSYDRFTFGHNRVIYIRGGMLAESSQSSASSISVKCNTCGSAVHSTTNHNEFDHFKKGFYLITGVNRYSALKANDISLLGKIGMLYYKLILEVVVNPEASDLYEIDLTPSVRKNHAMLDKSSPLKCLEISPPKDAETPVESSILVSPSSSVGTSSAVRISKFVIKALLNKIQELKNNKGRTTRLDLYQQPDKIAWTELKRLLTNKYCPRTEVEKMEDEFYKLVVKGNDLKTYIRIFQELALLCPNMVPNYEKLMEVFIGGLPRSIEGNVTASKPQTLKEAIIITQ
nr:reverse transcriptase domain-containing protein [Tanacetum cinerariifolium]